MDWYLVSVFNHSISKSIITPWLWLLPLNLFNVWGLIKICTGKQTVAVSNQQVTLPSSHCLYNNISLICGTHSNNPSVSFSPCIFAKSAAARLSKPRDNADNHVCYDEFWWQTDAEAAPPWAGLSMQPDHIWYPTRRQPLTPPSLSILPISSASRFLK